MAAWAAACRWITSASIRAATSNCRPVSPASSWIALLPGDVQRDGAERQALEFNVGKSHGLHLRGQVWGARKFPDRLRQIRIGVARARDHASDPGQDLRREESVDSGK